MRIKLGGKKISNLCCSKETELIDYNSTMKKILHRCSSENSWPQIKLKKENEVLHCSHVKTETKIDYIPSENKEDFF